MPLTIQLKQQSIKKLLLYSKLYKHSQIPVLLPPFLRESAEGPLFSSTFHSLNLENSPAHEFLCFLLDCRDTNLQFCLQQWLGQWEGTLLVNNIP